MTNDYDLPDEAPGSNSYPPPPWTPLPRPLSRRDQFAMAAMTGVLASDTGHESPVRRTVEWAVRCADALIKELDK